MQPWWKQKCPVTFEGAIALLTLIALMLLAVMMLAHQVSAASCLSIDVPAQAVLGNYDGDTFELFTFGSPERISIRVAGVNTPERTKKEPGWEAARVFTQQWLAKGPFRIDTCGKRSFERIVAEVMRDGESLADALKRAGLGSP